MSTFSSSRAGVAADAERLPLVVRGPGRQHPHRDLAGGRDHRGRDLPERAVAAHRDDQIPAARVDDGADLGDREPVGLGRQQLGVDPASEELVERGVDPQAVAAALRRGVADQEDVHDPIVPPTGLSGRTLDYRSCPPSG